MDSIALGHTWDPRTGETGDPVRFDLRSHFTLLGPTGCGKGATLEIGGPVAMEPKMHFGASLLQEGLDPEDAAVPDAQGNPNGTEEVFHAGIPQGFTSMGHDPCGGKPNGRDRLTGSPDTTRQC